MGEGEFPKQVALGARSVVWVKSQIEDWCESKLNGTQFNQYCE
ncbi:prophage CP4-57 regulatory family protein [Synechococcus sp. ROS8604]|nr:prophage CP4-57 regulatory family protein [Synechococcus sp. ROS8604]